MPVLSRAPLRLALTLACAAALLLAPGAAPVDAGEKVTLQLVQILGTDPGGGKKTFSPDIEEYRKQLEVFNYRVFKGAGKDKKDVGVGDEASFDLSSEPGFTVRATPKGSGSTITLDLRMTDPKGGEVLKTTLKIKDGGTSMINKELESKQGRVFLFFTVKKG